METQKPLLKDEDGKEVDVHMYRYQVNPKVSHLYAVKRIFRYLKGQPKLGLWYSKDSPFDLVAYTDSDYAGASLDKKSTIGDKSNPPPELNIGAFKVVVVYTSHRALNNSGIRVKAITLSPGKYSYKPSGWKEDIITELILTLMGYEKISQKLTFYKPSGPTTNVADETVNEEMEDSLEMAATTATSLDAEQDSGNIDKIQSKATLNEPSSSGTSSGSCPMRQETMGDIIAQTRSTNVSKLSNDPLLARVLALETTKPTQATEIASLKRSKNDKEHEADDDMGYDPSNVAFIEWLGSKNFNYKTMDQYTMKALWIYWNRGDDEVELIDEESSDDEEDIAEVFRIDTNIFDYETPLCSTFKEFNYLLEVDPELFTNDIIGFKTYEDYKNDWIYEWNKDVPWVDEKPWSDTEVWTKPTPVKHTCKPFNYKTGCSEWPTCNWKNDGYCNGGNLPRTYIIENQLHYQDYEWYKALEDCELKEALRNKAIVDGYMNDND
ncbi:hypothetical protein Tco_0369019 [Tanacetum coccineum]